MKKWGKGCPASPYIKEGKKCQNKQQGMENYGTI